MLIYRKLPELIVLIINRFPNQSLKIGDDVTVMIVEIQGDQVRLGIQAPRRIPVHREEIFERIRSQQALNECSLDGENSNEQDSK